MREGGTSDMVTAAAAGGGSGSKVMAGFAGRDLGAAGLGKADRLLAAAAVAGGVLAAVLAAALARGVVGTQAGLEGPADFVGLDPSAAAAAGRAHRAAVPAETVGAGYRRAAPQSRCGALGSVEKGVLAAHVGLKVGRGGPAEDKGTQSCSGSDTEAAAGQHWEGGRAERSSPGSVGCSPLGPAVRTQTSRQSDK